MNLAVLPFLLTFALINSCIVLEISAPSFLDIMVQLQTSESMVGRTITYNLIGFCLASIVYGPLSEYYGRRRIMLVGNGILAIGAVGCVIAPSIEFLLVTRFIQGIGAATSAVAVPVIVSDVYAARKAAKVSGVMNAFFTALGSIAPVLGGFINAAIGWRGNYGVVAVICVISWVLLFFLLSETKHSKEEISLRQVCHNYRKLLGNLLFVSAAIVPAAYTQPAVGGIALQP